MKDQDRFELLFGPYEPPRIPRNGMLLCKHRGYLKVGKAWSDGPIPWPRRYRTASIILCGDLVRAVQKESVEAVSYHWGVCRNVVQIWRRALDVPEVNPGTRHLLRETHRDSESDARQRAILRAETPRAVLKPEPLLHERAHPLLRLSTSRLVKDRMARTGRHINPDLRLWTRKEDELLGSAPDEQIARKIKRSKAAVAVRRNALGIAAWNAAYFRPWTPDEEALLGALPDRDLARRLKRTFKAVEARRERYSLPPVGPLQRRFTPAEDALLGTMPDDEAAQQLGRSVDVVGTRRRSLNIPAKNPRYRSWTPAEDKLLGTVPDDKVATHLNRPLQSVRDRRILLGIPNRFPKVSGWSPAEIKLLGTLPDQEVSRLVNRSKVAVQSTRYRLGIPLFVE
jgi:hypothetical protein